MSESDGNGLPEAPEEALRRAAAAVRRRVRADRRRAPERLKPLLAYLETHLFEPALGVRRMALACGVRDHSIGSLFRSHFGKRLSCYITDLRLEVAETLLRDTQLPVWQVGELVGYSQTSVFSSAFRRSRGMPPGAFRKRNRGVGAETKPDAARAAGAAAPTLPFLRRSLAGGLDAEEAARLKRWLHATYAPPFFQS